jgi:site-specific DNA recombinase
MSTEHSDSAPLALRRRSSTDEDMAVLAENLGGGVAEVPVAVFLRTSTRDLQDPTLSLPRHVSRSARTSARTSATNVWLADG